VEETIKVFLPDWFTLAYLFIAIFSFIVALFESVTISSSSLPPRLKYFWRIIFFLNPSLFAITGFAILNFRQENFRLVCNLMAVFVQLTSLFSLVTVRFVRRLIDEKKEQPLGMD